MATAATAEGANFEGAEAAANGEQGADGGGQHHCPAFACSVCSTEGRGITRKFLATARKMMNFFAVGRNLEQKSSSGRQVEREPLASENVRRPHNITTPKRKCDFEGYAVLAVGSLFIFKLLAKEVP